MGIVVGVHGIAQELKGPQVLAQEWGPPLSDGVSAAGKTLSQTELVCPFYGGLFRPPGNVRAVGETHYRVADVTDDEAELLMLLWEEAARLEPDRVSPPTATTRGATPGSVQAALRILSRSRFFAGLAEYTFIGTLKQVRRYLREAELRDQAQRAVDAAVDEGTRVLVAHSLGSVVAYEALHRFGTTPRWANVKTLVTLGSPLGIANLIFHQLKPGPVNDQGQWPQSLTRWTNISDDGDVVALVKKLAPLFGAQIADVRIQNGAHAHSIMPYLTAVETGRAIAEGLT
jgi:hypothetical protein